MLRAVRRACTSLALIALASLGGVAAADARGERNVPERHEHRPAEGARQSTRREAVAQQSRRTQAARAQAARAAQRREEPRPYAHPAAGYHREAGYPRETNVRGVNERHPTDGAFVRGPQLAGGGRGRETSYGLAGNQVHVVRYGNRLSGTVERTIRPGLVSRTFVGGGHVLYSRVYQQQVWNQYGRAFAYETFVPAVRYPMVYYSWALGVWPRPVVYTWGWPGQPWYPAYGVLFTPYPVYTSPDLWMTDYIIARSMQTAYQAQTAPPAAPPIAPGTPATPAADASAAAPAPSPGDSSPAPQLSPPSEAAPPSQPSDAAPASDAPAAPAALPPAITPEIKAQLNTQIKVQLLEQQAAVATPASLTTQDTPPALRPNHVFFEVVHRIDVPSGTAKGYCTLSANDYIKRTGGMSQDDWKIPVVVELSGPSDCPQGLRTRVGLNDLNAMENEQEARVMEAMQAAAPSLGPNGPPAGAHPTLIADGSAAPDPMALAAIRQAQ